MTLKYLRIMFHRGRFFKSCPNVSRTMCRIHWQVGANAVQAEHAKFHIAEGQTAFLKVFAAEKHCIQLLYISHKLLP